jgi:hypothetical protein
VSQGNLYQKGRLLGGLTPTLSVGNGRTPLSPQQRSPLNVPLERFSV